MAEKDITEKTLEEYNDVFADIANVILFGGEQVIKEDELEDATPYSMYKIDDKLHEQERDCAKYWKKQKIRIALCGFENQTAQDRTMPLRVIGYDGAAYRAELTDDTQNELYPVITLVLYFGETHWTAPKHLTDCFTTDKRLKPFVSDYKINVVEVAFLTEETISQFNSDFRIIADFFRQSRLGHYNPSQDDIHHADEVFKLMSVLTKDKRFDETYNNYKSMNNGECGGVAMCKVLDDLINERYETGIEAGIEKGIEKGMKEGAYNAKVETAQNLRRMGMSSEQISLATGLPENEINNIK
ncbi:MAG: Rpn family recombination-promoting nuclease/putative transposase [Spirochaetales bacterium]|nr:Rpn family recombination-promoting nuclease/putative transposase [Spirochaetales bacterium]